MIVFLLGLLTGTVLALTWRDVQQTWEKNNERANRIDSRTDGQGSKVHGDDESVNIPGYGNLQ